MFWISGLWKFFSGFSAVKMEVEPNNKEAGVFITSDGDTVVKIYNVL
jgi:hypothetical protein